MAIERITVLNNATITATGSGSAVSVYDFLPQANTPSGYVTVGTVTGTTPNLVMRIQHSPDGTTWSTLFTHTAITSSNGKDLQTFTAVTLVPALLPYVRADYTVTGTTPNFGTVNVYLYVNTR